MTSPPEDTARGRHPGPPASAIGGGARTPEELETLLEDAFVTRDPAALGELFEAGALLVAGDGPPARGAAEIARWAVALWAGDGIYVADPRWVLQARDLALIVAERGASVARRGSDGAWRYAIIRLSFDVGPQRSECHGHRADH